MDIALKEKISKRYGNSNTLRKGVSEILSPELRSLAIRAQRIGEICVINGTRYQSFTDASKRLGEERLTPSEVRRRCLSRKIKYRDWTIEGLAKTPQLRLSIDGRLFESASHAHKYLPSIPKSLIENRCLSGNPQYRHWVKLETPITEFSYEWVDSTLNEIPSNPIKERLTTIRCEGIEFYTQAEAAEYFGVSIERIRQKLESDRYPSYQYLY